MARPGGTPIALLCALPLERVALAGMTGDGVLLARTGAGMARGRAGAERAISAGAGALVSVGFCGGADPDLSPGDVIVATEVVDAESGRTLGCDAGLCARVPGRRGALETRARVARTPSERRASPSIAIDMESAAIADAAVRADIPFAAVRAVSDAEHTRLPDAIDASGELRLGAIRPGDLPDLARLGAGAARAMLALRRAIRQLRAGAG